MSSSPESKIDGLIDRIRSSQQPQHQQQQYRQHLICNKDASNNILQEHQQQQRTNRPPILQLDKMSMIPKPGSPKAAARPHDLTFTPKKKVENAESDKRLKEIMKISGNITVNGVIYRTELKDMEQIEELGNGTYGHVVKMCHKPSGKIIAVKQMRRSGNNEENKRIVMDIEVVIKSHDCPYIVRCLGCFITDPEVWICMELMATCFDKLLKRLKRPIPERVLGKVTVATVKALSYLKETHGVIHRDVKPSNILLDERGNVKLCDFGISGHLVDSMAQTKSAGCAGYIAPERIDPDNKNSNYDIRADVWSLGITLVELATGVFPYRDCKTDFEVLTKVVEQEPPKLPDDQEFSAEFRRFVTCCLIKDQKLRPKYVQLQNEPFIQKYEKIDIDVGEWFRNAMRKVDGHDEDDTIANGDNNNRTVPRRKLTRKSQQQETQSTSNNSKEGTSPPTTTATMRITVTNGTAGNDDDDHRRRTRVKNTIQRRSDNDRGGGDVDRNVCKKKEEDHVDRPTATTIVQKASMSLASLLSRPRRGSGSGRGGGVEDTKMSEQQDDCCGSGDGSTPTSRSPALLRRYPNDPHYQQQREQELDHHHQHNSFLGYNYANNTSPILLQRFIHQQRQQQAVKDMEECSNKSESGTKKMSSPSPSYVRRLLHNHDGGRSSSSTSSSRHQSPDPPPRFNRGVVSSSSAADRQESPLALRRNFFLEQVAAAAAATTTGGQAGCHMSLCSSPNVSRRYLSSMPTPPPLPPPRRLSESTSVPGSPQHLRTRFGYTPEPQRRRRFNPFFVNNNNELS